MKSETLYWTIGGVAIALLALLAMSRSSGGAATAPAAAGGINASALVSEVNAANTNATSVENNLLSSETQYVLHSTDAQAGAFQSLVSGAQHELDAIEGAQTARYAAGVNASAQEYADQTNALTTQFVTTQNNSLALQEAQIGANVAHFESDNAVTMERIAKGSSFSNFMQSLVGAASNFFSSQTGAAALGVGR